MPRPKKNNSNQNETPVLTEIKKEAIVEKEIKKRSPRKKKEDLEKPIEQKVLEPIVETKGFDNTIFSNEIIIEEIIIERIVNNPIVQEPVVEEVIQEPVVEEVIQEPVVEEVAIQEPVVEEVIQEPDVEKVIQEHVIEEVAIQEPVLEDVVIQEPVLEEVIQESVLEEVSIQEHVVEEVAIQEPVVEEVVIEEPIIEEVVKEPIVEEVVIEEPPPNLDNEVCERLKECSAIVQNLNKNSEEKTEEIIEELMMHNNISMKVKKVVHFEENTEWKYSMKDLTMLFGQFNEAFMIIQKKNGVIRYIEKKGYETRNSSVIDLIIETDKSKSLPDFQIAIFTNDELKKEIRQKNPYLFSFCNNESDINPLFPNFNFIHWLEAGIGSYKEFYNMQCQNPIPWEQKKDLVFWSGSNTSKIREKMFIAAQNNKNFLINLILKNQNPIKYYPIDSHSEFKYLLNMNGNSYAGRLNYLFMTGSCVIIMKNRNSSYQWNEFFTKEFIADEDFIEIEYDDNEKGQDIIQRIEQKIKTLNGEQIAKSGFIKAIQLFNRENIYNYIHQEITRVSQHLVWDIELKSTIEFLPPSRIYLDNRLDIIEKKSCSFKYLGYHMELMVFMESSNPLDKPRQLNILLRNTEIFITEDSNIIQRKNIAWLGMQKAYHDYTLLIIPEIKQLVLQVNQKYGIGNVKLISEGETEENPTLWYINRVLIRNLEKVGKLIH